MNYFQAAGQRIYRAYAIDNPALRTRFDDTRTSIRHKLRRNPQENEFVNDPDRQEVFESLNRRFSVLMKRLNQFSEFSFASSEVGP
jgi:hypothetical protein